jgi:hypothetical protein
VKRRQLPAEDPWASHPMAWVTVFIVICFAPVAAIATARGVDAGLLAAAWIYGLPVAGALLLVVIVLLLDAIRAVRRRRWDARRDVALSDDRPGPAELAEDFAAAAVNFPYPAERRQEV